MSESIELRRTAEASSAEEDAQALREAADTIERLRSQVTTLTAEQEQIFRGIAAMIDNGAFGKHPNPGDIRDYLLTLANVAHRSVRAAVGTAQPVVVTHAPGCRIWRRLYENGEAALRFTCDCGSLATPEETQQ